MSLRKEWMRLTGSHRTRKISRGLQARMADPLWMLARQWQFGEFKGDDAATPAKVALKYTSLKVEHYQAYTENGKAGKWRTIRDDALLESTVECDPVRNGPASLRVSADAAIQFLRRIPQPDRAKVRSLLSEKFPLQATHKINPGRDKFFKLMLQKGFDGQAFFARGQAFLGEVSGISMLTAPQLRKIYARWQAYYSARFSEPEQDESSWQKARLEYRFNLSTPKKAQTTVQLSAQAYPGGHLDWYQFDLDKSGSKGLSRVSKQNQTLWLIPGPVRYAGMPADRFWDFEDGKVNFGGLNANATDLAQIVLTEFATVYSNDWYMLPVPVETGSLTRISAIVVYDSFGESHEIRPAAAMDGDQRVWRFFELSGDNSAEQGFSPWLYVPRTVLGGHEDRPVENVTFSRDDMANLAWGIEETIEGQSGHRVSRREQWFKRRSEMDAYISEYTQQNPFEDSSEIDEAEREAELKGAPGQRQTSQNRPVPAWKYRLLSIVPPYWIPFVPEVANDLTTNRLIRGRMSEWDLLGAAKSELAGAQGRLLRPEAPMFIQEEEIPRGAIEVSRSYQAAREPDGGLVVWAGRKKRPASGNRSSGRETDRVERPDK